MSEQTTPSQAQSPLSNAVDLLLAAKAQVERMSPSLADPVKPGFKTSEFWLTAIHSLASLVAGSGAFPGFTDPTLRATTLGSALVSIGMYIVSRVKAKGR